MRLELGRLLNSYDIPCYVGVGHFSDSSTLASSMQAFMTYSCISRVYQLFNPLELCVLEITNVLGDNLLNDALDMFNDTGS